MERRIVTLAAHPLRIEMRVGTDPPAPVIVGLASVFYQKDDAGTEYSLWDYDDDRCVERVMSSAFDEVLKANVDCAGLFNHDPNQLLGRTSAGTMKLEKTSAGLRYSITPPDSPLAKGVVESIQRGDLKGSSFSFSIKGDGQRWVRQGKLCVREIHSVDQLVDCGPVTFPAYASTSTGTRSDGPNAEANKAFLLWRKRVSQAQAEARARCVRLGL
jgi:HK97 family phage prohead protease